MEEATRLAPSSPQGGRCLSGGPGGKDVKPPLATDQALGRRGSPTGSSGVPGLDGNPRDRPAGARL